MMESFLRQKMRDFRLSVMKVEREFCEDRIRRMKFQFASEKQQIAKEMDLNAHNFEVQIDRKKELIDKNEEDHTLKISGYEEKPKFGRH